MNAYVNFWMYFSGYFNTISHDCYFCVEVHFSDTKLTLRPPTLFLSSLGSGRFEAWFSDYSFTFLLCLVCPPISNFSL